MHASFRVSSAWMAAFLLATNANAQEPGRDSGSNFYIAQQHPEASDDNPGTADRPFLTIEGAFLALAPVVQPGDTIWIQDGLYRRVNLRLIGAGVSRPGAIVFPSGTGYAQMISIQAYPGHRPILNQAVVVTNWTRLRDDIWTADFTEDTRHVFPITFADGQPLQQIGGTVRRNPEYWSGKKGEGPADLEAGSFFFDEDAKRLHVWLADGGDPNERLMEAYADGARFSFGPGLEFIRVAGLTLRYGGIGLQAGHSVLEDLDQAWAPKNGAFLAWEYNTVIRCKFNHNGNTGMSGRGRGHRIIDSETNHNNWRRWSTGWGAGGIKFIPQWHDIVIKGHTAAYNHGDGIWFDAFMSNVTIEGCRSFRNEGAGIHYEIGSRGVIKNNVIYENGHRGIYLSNSSYSAVLHNVVYRNGMSGIAVIGVERGGGVYGRGEQRYMPAGHNVVWGNILVDNCWDASRDLERFPNWGNRPELILPSDREGNEGCVSDYNVFFRTGERGERMDRLSFARNFDLGFAAGIDEWREKTGWDRNSIVADPRFVHAAEYNFRLAEGSPALWMVRELDHSMRLDFDGQERSRNIQSAGPFEGDAAELARIHRDPPAGKFRLFPLKARSGQALGESINLARYARAILYAEHAAEMGFGLVGVKVLDIPFLRGSSDYIVLDSACREATLPLGGEVKVLHFLFSAEKVKPGVPAVEAWITRADGQTLRVEWSIGETGDWTAQPANLTSTRLGHAGTFARIPKDPPGASVFITTWTNENEWLPVEKVEFKLLDPEAQFFFLGVSGERTEQ